MNARSPRNQDIATSVLNRLKDFRDNRSGLASAFNSLEEPASDHSAKWKRWRRGFWRKNAVIHFVRLPLFIGVDQLRLGLEGLSFGNSGFCPVGRSR